MTLSASAKLGTYEIIVAIGAGGMGEVYRAKDTKLRREVALKILPASLANDPERVARFRREAQVVAALNHPHIGQIYGLEEANGTQFLVLELVDGESLDKRIARRPIPVDEALGIAKQIAEALEAAHEKGIIHRDLKPANIVLTKDGSVKVLDFGLAKAVETTSGSVDAMNSPTITSPAMMTGVGVILGTAAYMSPEQTRGRQVDTRADVWAFGCVLFELLAGRQAFRGETLPDVTASVLERAPDWKSLPRSTPPKIRNLLKRALAKDPQRRLREVGEVRLALDQAQQVGRRRLSLRLIAGAALGATAALIALSVEPIRLRVIGPNPSPRVQSLAVLPLDNLSRDPEQDYFAEGMTEALITNLAQIKALRVISRTSVMRYKGTNKPLRQIARELNVDAIVEGSVQPSGSHVRITAELVDASTDRSLWAKSYERDLADVLGLQDEIGEAVVREIQVEITPQERARLITSPRQVKPDAYEAYLRGRYFWNRVTEEAVTKAIGFFQEAVEKDPGYAPAYAGLADCYSILGSTILGAVQPRDAMPKAKAAALKALEIDGTVAEAHASLALATWRYDWDWVTGEREFKRAIELSPGYSAAHQWYGWYLYGLGRVDESLAELTRAQQADPLSVWIHSNKGLALYFGRRYDRSIEQLTATLDMDNTFILGHFFLGLSLEQVERFPEALRSFGRPVECPAEVLSTSPRWGTRTPHRGIESRHNERSTN
jgi:serine/threonine-protein kinase